MEMLAVVVAALGSAPILTWSGSSWPLAKPHFPGNTIGERTLTAAGQGLFDEAFAPIVNKVVRPFELNFTDDELETVADLWF